MYWKKLPSSYNKTPVTPIDQLRLRASFNSLSSSASVSNLVAELVYARQNKDFMEQISHQPLAKMVWQESSESNQIALMGKPHW